MMGDLLHELKLKLGVLEERTPSEGEIRHLRKTDHALHVAYQEVKGQLRELEVEVNHLKSNVLMLQTELAQMQMLVQHALGGTIGSTEYGH